MTRFGVRVEPMERASSAATGTIFCMGEVGTTTHFCSSRFGWRGSRGGGDGDDSLDGGDGSDTLDGGDGRDTCINAESEQNCE
jgi:hypothetical protein